MQAVVPHFDNQALIIIRLALCDAAIASPQGPEVASRAYRGDGRFGAAVGAAVAAGVQGSGDHCLRPLHRLLQACRTSHGEPRSTLQPRERARLQLLRPPYNVAG